MLLFNRVKKLLLSIQGKHLNYKKKNMKKKLRLSKHKAGQEFESVCSLTFTRLITRTVVFIIRICLLLLFSLPLFVYLLFIP